MIEPVNGSSELLSEKLSVSAQGKEKDKSFSQILNNGIKKVNQLQVEADNKSQNFALGKIDNIHDVTIATEKAKLALNLTLAVQNKVLDAYNKVMRMQV